MLLIEVHGSLDHTYSIDDMRKGPGLYKLVREALGDLLVKDEPTYLIFDSVPHEKDARTICVLRFRGSKEPYERSESAIRKRIAPLQDAFLKRSKDRHGLALLFEWF